MSNTNFPASIDTPTDPQSTQFLNNPSHSGQHGFENDAIVALETKVGVDSSAVTTTIDYLLKNTASIDPGHKHSFASLTGFSVTSPNVNDILTYNGSVFTNKANLFKYGGTGSDGALNITSGTTTINLGNAAIVVKNYTSISITGSAKLAFSNPNVNGTIVILKSQGNVTITSATNPAIDCSGLGSQGGSGATSGTSSFWSGFGYETGGATGVSGGSSTSAAAAGGSFSILSPTYSLPSIELLKYGNIFVGSGGGSGVTSRNNSATVTAGAGGNGGGALIIECGSALNFTSTLSVAGINGANGAASGGSGGNAGTASGAGGGGGGFLLMTYNTLTANSGSVTITGGTGGTFAVTGSGVNTCTSGGGGGAGITAGTASNAVTGGAGVASSNGGAGSAGFSLITANTTFA